MITVPYEVKKALRDGMLRKNYRFVVLNDDGTEDFTIDNDTLVSESVNIDERMCSGDTLKFGLCEGSSLEFQYFDHPNITGRRVQVFVDVQYALKPYEDVGLIDTGSSGEEYRYDVTENGDYRIYIEPNEVPNVRTTSSVSVSHAGPTNFYDMEVKPDGHGEVVLLGCTTIDSIYLWAKTNRTAKAIVQIFRGNTYSIPMGFFDVKKCSRQASTGIMKVTAYNKLMSDYLDAKANDMLFDSFTEATDVTIFDIQSILLNDYQIYMANKSKVKQTQQAYNTGYVSLGDYHFTKEYGVNSFLNADIFSTYKTSGFGLTLELMLPQLSASSNARVDALYGSIIQLEQIFVKYLRDLIDGAELDVSFDTVLNNICANTGFQYYFGLRVQTLNPIGWKYYSTIQWDYEEAHGLTHTVAGTLQDICKLGEYFNATLYIPDKIRVYDYGDHTGIFARGELNFTSKCYYDGAWHDDYKYYSDSQQTESTGTVSPLIFSDLTPYAVQNPFANKEYIFWLWKYNDLADADLITVNTGTLPEFTLRDIATASYETQCQFGQLSRTTDLFSGVDLNYGGLYPADTLYPANDLYPGGAVMSANKAMYSQLWADEGNVHKWRNLVITYKGLDEEQNEVDIVHERVIDANGTDDYNMSDNWLFRNLIWTEEQIDDYADAMIAKMQDVTWFPFEMWLAGLPYLETGDQIEIPLNGEVYTSYVLQRQLKGIQNLQDTYINGTLDIF